ncbi:hypothetical protein GCM10010211_82400 [Streptomyces albospinus]|uniref:Uncharacterized protein n=1 Tax=Streptomyces albospinus TaxID=285515 RepID=A0ABQ2VNL0_9ACTN|nr:hypothetical protein [Streptomyces albospinus]GGV02563.1 hypothetical protein GCM10010211_82400 [Streptomyces albospinus]
MNKPLYTLESEDVTELENLGYNACVHDLVVQAAHKELNRFVQNEGEAVKMWGWDPGSLHDADRYRITQLLRSFTYQEQRIVAALKRLDEQYRYYIASSPQARAHAEAFIDSLNKAAARRAVDCTVGRLAGAWLTESMRDRLAKDVVAKWKQKAPEVDAHASSTQRDEDYEDQEAPPISTSKMDVLNQGEWLVADVIADSIKAVPGLSQLAKDIASRPKVTDQYGNEVPYDPEEWDGDSYLPPAFRRLHALRSIVDFHDPEIARELGWRGSFSESSSPWDSEGNERPEDTSFKASGFDMDLWRLKDRGYPTERIPDGLLYDLVDIALAVQAEYQLQCFFVDRELAKVIETRGKEEQWLYQKTADWAAELAKAKQKEIDRWSFWGDVLGMVSAVAGVLTFIPGVSLIAGPIAVITAAASLGLHAKAISLKGKVDVADGVTLATDVLSALPVVGAVAKGAKGAWAAARLNKVANVIVSNSGRAFVGAIASKSASDAARVFDYLGKKGAQVVTGTLVESKIPGKVLQGAVALATQVPTAVDWASPVDQVAKDTAAGTALTANVGQTIGEWDTVGAFTKKVGTLSLERFSRFFRSLH